MMERSDTTNIQFSVFNIQFIAYKVAVSIIFGLLGFAVNFYFSFSFPPYTAAILIGLLFPVLITLTWGWKYGLLSALTGGCQSMWFLWGPSNGYAAFFVVPPFTLWIIWHGICANLRRKQKDPKWWLSIYTVEVPFRILSTINLYTLCRWAITLNPPPWDWASGSTNIIPVHFSNFVVIKQCVVAYIVLLLADVLLKFKFIRTFFKQKEQYPQENSDYIMSAFIAFGVLFWVFDSLLGFLVFYDDISFLDLLALNIPSHQIWARAFVIVACLIGGLTTIRMFYRQQESDKALQESEKKLSQTVQGISIATFVIDKKRFITHWNRACENLTGVSANQMVGTKKQWSVFYSKERPVLADLILDKLSEEEIAGYYGSKIKKNPLIQGAYNAEAFFSDLSKNGKWLFFTAAPLRNQQGKVIGAIETFQDITERKQAEKELAKYRDHLKELVRKRTAELEKRVAEVEQLNIEMVNLSEGLQISNKSLEATTHQLGNANKELEAFSYSVSHDLRAPLRNIDGFSQILLEDYSSVLDKQGQHYLQRVRAGTQNMGRLIDDILSLSRTGRHHMNKKTINMESIVKEVCKSLENELKNRKVDFTLHECPTAFADSHLVKIVFTNLLSNALKFTRIRENAKIETGSMTEDGHTVFFIKDNGAGFDMNYADKLFIPFQRLHRAEEYEGSGIGLAIVQRIIHRHGGRIWAKSEIDVGTTFYFTFSV